MISPESDGMLWVDKVQYAIAGKPINTLTMHHVNSMLRNISMHAILAGDVLSEDIAQAICLLYAYERQAAAKIQERSNKCQI